MGVPPFTFTWTANFPGVLGVCKELSTLYSITQATANFVDTTAIQLDTMALLLEDVLDLLLGKNRLHDVEVGAFYFMARPLACVNPSAFFSTQKDSSKRFSLPKKELIFKRFFGGLGLGVSGSIAAGCTVGHGLTFAPLLGIGSLVATLFIFLGSGLVGYLTKP